MTAFADFLDLRTAVVEQVGRPDIADIFPRLTLLAEARFNRKLKLRDQITEVTLTVASGIAALPSDFIEMIGVYTENGNEYVQQPLQNVKQSFYYQGGSLGGQQYAIDGTNIQFPFVEGDIVVQYYAQLPTISGSMTASNWMLQKYPEIYLYGTAFEAAKWLRDKEMASDMGSLLGDALNDAAADDHGARYSRTRVRVMGVTP